MPIDFPSSPSLNQTYTSSGRTWLWNGYAWELQNRIVGFTGSVGYTGSFGSIGYTGSKGDTGATGAQYGTRVVTAADGTSITMNADTSDMVIHDNTQVAGTLTINAPTGTIVDGQKLMLRIKSLNVQTYSWNGVFAGSTDLPLPLTTTGSSKYDYLGFVYNSQALKWHMLSSISGF